MKTIAIVTLLLLVTACSTSQVSWSRTQPIQPERQYAFTQPASKEAAEITIVRDEGAIGSLCYYAVLVDEKLAARIAITERASFFVEPGLHEFKVIRDPKGDGLCRVGDDAVEKMMSIKSGEQRRYRLTLDYQGWPSINSYVE